MKKTLSLAIGLAFASAAAFAAEPLPPILQKLPGPPKVLASQAVDGTPLTAWLLQMGPRMGVVYTGPGGRYLIAGGQVLTEKGVAPVSQTLLQDYYTHHDFKPLVEALRKEGALVHQGHAGPLVYVFWDPNCIYCHKLWDEVQSAIGAGKLQVDWAPVAILKPSSAAKAAAILASPSPLKAMREDETRFNTRTEEGGITPPGKLPAKAREQVQANTRLFERYGMQGTPSIVYRDPAGAWHVIPGYVPLQELLTRIGAK